ncbi:hypothetical protein FQZ97_1167400 [compost metagenome]
MSALPLVELHVLEIDMKALKALFFFALVGIAAPVFAEGGSDRLIQQIEARHASSISR